MDFQLNIRPVREGGWGSIENNTITGLLGTVYYGKSDIGAGYVSSTSFRYKYVDFSASYRKNTLILISVKPLKGLNKFTAFLQPLSVAVWIVLFVSTVAASFALYLVKSISIYEETCTFFGCTWQMMQIILWDKTNIKITTLGPFFIITFYMLSTYVIVSEYMGSFTSFMAAEPSMWQPIDSLEDFANSNLQWFGAPGTAGYESLYSDRTLAPRMANEVVDTKNIGGVNQFTEFFNEILDHPEKYVVVWMDGAAKAWIDLHFVDTAGNDAFHISKEGFGGMNIAFFMQKQAIYREKFNLNLLRLIQSGIVERIFDQVKFNFLKMGKARARDQGRIPVKKKENVLQLKHLISCFFVISILGSLTFVVFIAERVWVFLVGKSEKDDVRYF